MKNQEIPGSSGAAPVYLDYCATTPLAPPVLASMMPALQQGFGNPSSLHVFGREAKAMIETARAQVAQRIGAQPQEIHFTSGATEADNMAVFGVAAAQAETGGHLITSSIEHHAVLHAAQRLEKLGWQATYLPVDSGGRIDPADVAQAIRTDTRLISVMMVNNETGAIQPVREVGVIAREHGVLFHTDAVQAAGLLPIAVDELGVGLLSLSGHKVYGPKGVGALYVREGTPLVPLVYGGPQEGELRAGTENVPGIVGLGAAAALTLDKMQAEYTRLQELRSVVLEGLHNRIPHMLVNGKADHTSPHVLSLTFPGSDGEMMLFLLNQRGVAVSMGSACNARVIAPSHVLLAMGFSPAAADATLRISFGYPTTNAEVNYLMDVLPQIVEQCRQMQ